MAESEERAAGRKGEWSWEAGQQPGVAGSVSETHVSALHLLEYTPGSSCCLLRYVPFFFITIMVLLLLHHLVLSFI